MLPTYHIVGVERVAEGVSTWVYRVICAEGALYLRVLPETGSYEPEAYVHHAIAARGASVPQVVFWEHHNAALGHSVMITAEIAGRALDALVDASTLRTILRAAGRELASANTVRVDGWGWVDRLAATGKLVAPHPTFRAWQAEGFNARMAAFRQHNTFDAATLHAISACIVRWGGLFDADTPQVAHGDFDVSHIFVERGTYTGIIDWGEIRGAQPFYDLGHFALHNGALLPSLLAGYADVTPLPADIEQRMHLTGLLIALERMGGGLMRRPERPPFPPYVAGVYHMLAALDA